MYWYDKLNEECNGISYLDSEWLKKLDAIEEFINRLSISNNFTHRQLEYLQKSFNTAKFGNLYKQLKSIYMEKGKYFYETLEYDKLSKKEKQQYCEYLFGEYNKIKDHHIAVRLGRENTLDKDERNLKKFYNDVLKKLNIIENFKITPTKRLYKELTKFPIKLLENEELLRELVELDLDILTYRNEFLLRKKIFYIMEFIPSEIELVKNRKTNIQFKIFQYFRKNGIESIEKYNILEIANIFAQFGIHELEMANGVLSAEKERLLDLYKKMYTKLNYKKINNRGCSILKIVLSFSRYPDLKKALKEQGIWDKYYGTTKEGDYEIYINLANINVTYNKEKVYELQEEQKNDISYVEAEKQCRIQQIEQIELEAKMLLKDGQQEEVLEQMLNLKNRIQNGTRALKKEEQDEITNLLNKCEDNIRLKIEQYFEEENKKTRDVTDYFCKNIIEKNLKQLQSLTRLKEKIELLNKIAKAHEILKEVLNVTSYIEEIFWQEKFEILKREAIKLFLLGKDENIFLEFLNENEINRVNCEYRDAAPYYNPYKNYVEKEYKKILLQYTSRKENWRFEYLQLPIYRLEEFDFDNDAKKIIEEKGYEAHQLRNYSILEIHQLASKLGILENLQLSKNQMKDHSKDLIYEMYKDELFNKEIANYLGEEEIKQSDKIQKNNESIIFSVREYVEY